jgi:hypothetical protein
MTEIAELPEWLAAVKRIHAAGRAQWSTVKIPRRADALSARSSISAYRDQDGRLVFEVVLTSIGGGKDECRAGESTSIRSQKLVRVVCWSVRRPAHDVPFDRVWRPDPRPRTQPTAFVLVDPHASIGNVEKLCVQGTARHQRKLVIVAMSQAGQVPKLMGP